MSQEPTIMICLGATKSGTSALYRYLHDHPDCHMRSLKELQYFSTIEIRDYERQFDVLDRLVVDLKARKETARAAGEGWRVKNLQRQINDAKEVRRIIGLGEEGLSDYLFYLLDGIEEHKLVGDITPAYALLSEARFAQMLGLSKDVRFVFLMRDPVDRLWSHVRMQAKRQQQPGEELPVKSRRIMNRTMHKNEETHIPKRGDYIAIIEKLRRVIPKDKLYVGFTEDVLSGRSMGELCAFLGIEPMDVPARTHEGLALEISPRQRREAAAFLAAQYDFAEAEFGPLPLRWQQNRDPD